LRGRPYIKRPTIDSCVLLMNWLRGAATVITAPDIPYAHEQTRSNRLILRGRNRPCCSLLCRAEQAPTSLNATAFAGINPPTGHAFGILAQNARRRITASCCLQRPCAFYASISASSGGRSRRTHACCNPPAAYGPPRLSHSAHSGRQLRFCAHTHTGRGSGRCDFPD
jgi:hypothetical protein